MKIKTFFAALLILTASGVFAANAPAIVVEGVQMPAWVEHAGGARNPLTIGMGLSNKDRIHTGPGSRALLRVADGSFIKLGENGLLALDDLGGNTTQLQNLVTASLDVVSGAFRFTTQALSRFRGQRDVTVRIATITAGIRGTDVWGKSESTRDIICLVEGRITVVRDKDAFIMDQPMSFYIAPKNEPPLPVARVSQQQLEQWVRETEILAGAGGARSGGRWRVYLGEVKTQGDALAFYDQLRADGYAAEIRPARTEAGSIYRLRISNLVTRADAEVLAGQLKERMGISEPRVAR